MSILHESYRNLIHSMYVRDLFNQGSSIGSGSGIFVNGLHTRAVYCLYQGTSRLLWKHNVHIYWSELSTFCLQVSTIHGTGSFDSSIESLKEPYLKLIF